MGWVSCQEDNDERIDNTDLSLAMNKHYTPVQKPKESTSAYSANQRSVSSLAAQKSFGHIAIRPRKLAVSQTSSNQHNLSRSKPISQSSSRLSHSFAASLIRKRMDDEYRLQGKIVGRVQDEKQTESSENNKTIRTTNKVRHKKQNKSYKSYKGEQVKNTAQSSSNSNPQQLAIEGIVCRAFRTSNNVNKWINLADLGNLLNRTHPGFNPQSYGFTKLTGLVKSLRHILDIDVRNQLDILVRLKH